MDICIKSVYLPPRIAIFIVMFGAVCFAAPRPANADEVSALHLQITQTATPLLITPAKNITTADLQSLVVLAQKYFSTRKKIEEPVFKQRLENQRLHRYNADSLYEEPLPSEEETLIAVFRQYISAHPVTSHANVASLTQLRNLLRQLQTFDDGRLSGYTWLYNSPLPVFAAQQLQPLDQHIINSSFASAAAFRKKHQYAAAIKIYKTLLADYVNTPHEAAIKVLLDAAIVEDYNYQAQLALAKHDYETARNALKQIIALYPDSDYATAAQKALDGIVPVAVRYYKQQGDKYFHPEGHYAVPQTKAGEFFEKMYNENPKGIEAGYALYYWARSLGTEGKVKEALDMLKNFSTRFPHSEMKGEALFLKAFYYSGIPIQNRVMGAKLMMQFVHEYPKAKQVPDALWYAAFDYSMAGQQQNGIDALKYLQQHFPNSNHTRHVPKWINKFAEGWPQNIRK